jgi:hypothetical protein
MWFSPIQYIRKFLFVMKLSWTTNSFWDVNNKNDVNGTSLSHLSYLIILMAYLCSQRTPNVQIMYFMFDWSIYRLVVLNRGWKCDSLQIMIFVRVSSTWGIVTQKRFGDVNNKKWQICCKFVSSMLLKYTYGLPVITMDPTCPNHVFYVWFVDLQTICAK